MPRRRADTKTFQNEQLVLRVSESVDSANWNESRYERFFDALSGNLEFQKDALRACLRFLVGGRYASLRQLAEENFSSNDTLQDRFGSFREMERHLLLPDQLYCALDLATGTGKSYVLYGLAAILLAEGVVDRVLVLCPSNTIEAGLLAKFRELAGDDDLRSALPSDAKVSVPSIIEADVSIEAGCICVENYHSILAGSRSSIRDSLLGKGATTLVLNDEVHHVASGGQKERRKWKEFLEDPEFGFTRLVGVSGTCYVGDDYFGDVVSRYSLRQAIEDRVVKRVDYVAEANIGADPDERRQIVYANHRANQKTYRKVKPVTIVVTRDIKLCEQVAQDWIDFLVEKEGSPKEEAENKVLVVTSAAKHAPNLAKLVNVDSDGSPVEWIFSVSMLTEGWDVKNVFQVVPHEKRAFNSKLLISQVLGRGLRVPPAVSGQPVVTVFNHDAWSSSIKHLVEEVLEIEKRLTSRVVEGSSYHFDLHTIDYTRDPESKSFEQAGEYDLLKKGYVDLPSQLGSIEREVEYEEATTGKRYMRKTAVSTRMYTVDEVASTVFQRLKSIDLESEALEEKRRTSYAKKHDLEWCANMVRSSTQRAGESGDQVSEENRQKILSALGPLSRGSSKAVRYQLQPKAVRMISTTSRPASSVSMNVLRRGDAALFYTSDSAGSFPDEERSIFEEAVGPDSELPAKSFQEVANTYQFKAPLNIVIADHDPERRFVRKLVEAENAEPVEGWIKSTDREFYPIEFSWRKGDHTKRASFNPDFFIRLSDRVVVVEIKDDSQIHDPAVENKKKAVFAHEHFERLNDAQDETVYQFCFLSPVDFDGFFQKLREGSLDGYRSRLDVALSEA